MTYNVFSGTLNPTQLNSSSTDCCQFQSQTLVDDTAYCRPSCPRCSRLSTCV